MGCVPTKQGEEGTVGFGKARVRRGLVKIERTEYYKAMLVREGGKRAKERWERDLEATLKWGSDVRVLYPEFRPMYPTLGGSKVDEKYFQMTEKKAEDAGFLLAVIAHKHPMLERLPILTPIVCILVTHLRLPEAYEATDTLLLYQENKRYTVPPQNEIEKYLTKIVKNKVGKDPAEYPLEALVQSFEKLYCDAVDYETCMRLFDTMVLEGVKVLYRMSLVLTCSKKSAEGEDLIAAMFDIQLSRDELHPSDPDKLPYEKPDVVLSGTVRHRPRLDAPSRVLTNPQEWEHIYSWIPNSFIKNRLGKRYDMNESGTSLTALRAACGSTQDPSVVLIRLTGVTSSQVYIMGYFLSHGLSLSSDPLTNVYSFPFTFTPLPSTLNPAPPHTFISHSALTPNSLVLGLLAGSSLLHFSNGSLERVTSDPGEVGLPPLNDRKFMVADFEVFAFSE